MILNIRREIIANPIKKHVHTLVKTRSNKGQVCNSVAGEVINIKVFETITSGIHQPI